MSNYIAPVKDMLFVLNELAGLDRVAVVPADQVEHAVGHEQLELGDERHAEAPRLAPGGLGRDHDLADQRARQAGRLEREGQHVGAPAHAPVHAIQAPDRVVVHDEHLDVAGRPANGRERPPGGPRQPRGGHRHAALTVHDRRGHQAPSATTPSAGAPPSRPRASQAS